MTRYLSFDQYALEDNRFIIMTVNAAENFMLKSILEQFRLLQELLPQYVSQLFVDEITGDKHYRLYNIASPGWTLDDKRMNLLKSMDAL